MLLWLHMHQRLQVIPLPNGSKLPGIWPEWDALPTSDVAFDFFLNARSSRRLFIGHFLLRSTIYGAQQHQAGSNSFKFDPTV